MLIPLTHRLRPCLIRCRSQLASKRAFSHLPERSRLSGLTTLAIETSCDDTSIAVLSIDSQERSDSVSLKSAERYHDKITARSEAYKGIHPVVALESHRAHIAELIQAAIPHLGPSGKPTFVSVTRGPGMRSNLAVGLDVARGLALAWNVPIVGVHHMQAHALTPRLCWTLENHAKRGNLWHDLDDVKPQFPYLTVLVSGGHTMLLNSRSLLDHDILAETGDIALGDCLDKAARLLLPDELLKAPYGRALERFAFPAGETDYKYTAPINRQEEIAEKATSWGWSLPPILQESRKMAYSFSGILTAVDRTLQRLEAAAGEKSMLVSMDERRELTRELLRVAFEHLASRMLIHLLSAEQQDIRTIVVSGGVASNQYLRHLLRKFLDARGFDRIKVVFPPVELCTDNALMIAWAGMEMFAAGYTTRLDVQPIRKWSMDATAEDGGILGADGWTHDSQQ